MLCATHCWRWKYGSRLGSNQELPKKHVNYFGRHPARHSSKSQPQPTVKICWQRLPCLSGQMTRRESHGASTTPQRGMEEKNLQIIIPIYLVEVKNLYSYRYLGNNGVFHSLQQNTSKDVFWGFLCQKKTWSCGNSGRLVLSCSPGTVQPDLVRFSGLDCWIWAASSPGVWSSKQMVQYIDSYIWWLNQTMRRKIFHTKCIGQLLLAIFIINKLNLTVPKTEVWKCLIWGWFGGGKSLTQPDCIVLT